MFLKQGLTADQATWNLQRSLCLCLQCEHYRSAPGITAVLQALAAPAVAQVTVNGNSATCLTAAQVSTPVPLFADFGHFAVAAHSPCSFFLEWMVSADLVVHTLGVVSEPSSEGFLHFLQLLASLKHLPHGFSSVTVDDAVSPARTAFP